MVEEALHEAAHGGGHEEEEWSPWNTDTVKVIVDVTVK
jgi:hypothetical protein